MKVQLCLTLNGEPVSIVAEPRETLADLVRERCNLTATHVGCEHGACGACTMLVDGLTTRSCLMSAVKAAGAQVTTFEGLANDRVMGVLKSMFHEHHALQCGFCTPGMLITARDILLRHRAPDGAVIRNELSGQLCRCTGYANIVKAIEAAGKTLATAGASSHS